jgi:DNA-binding response OmpR family regulator
MGVLFLSLLFVVKRGEAMARKMSIYTAVFERPDGTPEPKIVDVIVCKVRRKLAGVGGDGLIATVWGQGYRLDPTNGSPPILTGQMRRAAAKNKED